jgi:hypothetical protein
MTAAAQDGTAAPAASAATDETAANAAAQQAQGPKVLERVHDGFAIAPDFRVGTLNGSSARLAGAYGGWMDRQHLAHRCLGPRIAAHWRRWRRGPSITRRIWKRRTADRGIVNHALITPCVGSALRDVWAFPRDGLRFGGIRRFQESTRRAMNTPSSRTTAHVALIDRGSSGRPCRRTRDDDVQDESVRESRLQEKPSCGYSRKRYQRSARL